MMTLVQPLSLFFRHIVCPCPTGLCLLSFVSELRRGLRARVFDDDDEEGVYMLPILVVCLVLLLKV